MTPAEIKLLLKQKRLTGLELGRRWGVAPCTVYALVDRKFTSVRLERRLARVLKVRPSELRLHHCLLCHEVVSEVIAIPGFATSHACRACVEIIKEAVKNTVE